MATTTGRMRGAPSLADRLDALEYRRLDRSREPGRTLLLVGPALVAYGTPRVQRVGQDLREAGFGQPELIGE